MSRIGNDQRQPQSNCSGIRFQQRFLLCPQTFRIVRSRIGRPIRGNLSLPFPPPPLLSPRLRLVWALAINATHLYLTLITQAEKTLVSCVALLVGGRIPRWLHGPQWKVTLPTGCCWHSFKPENLPILPLCVLLSYSIPQAPVLDLNRLFVFLQLNITRIIWGIFCFLFLILVIQYVTR
jgi:hypothetical protein